MAFTVTVIVVIVFVSTIVTIAIQWPTFQGRRGGRQGLDDDDELRGWLLELCQHQQQRQAEDDLASEKAQLWGRR